MLSTDAGASPSPVFLSDNVKEAVTENPRKEAADERHRTVLRGVVTKLAGRSRSTGPSTVAGAAVRRVTPRRHPSRPGKPSSRRLRSDTLGSSSEGDCCDASGRHTCGKRHL